LDSTLKSVDLRVILNLLNLRF